MGCVKKNFLQVNFTGQFCLKCYYCISEKLKGKNALLTKEGQFSWRAKNEIAACSAVIVRIQASVITNRNGPIVFGEDVKA